MPTSKMRPSHRLAVLLILAAALQPLTRRAASAFHLQLAAPPAPRVVDLKSLDGTLLKATFFPAAKPGPGVLLLHQSNRPRSFWDDVARQLACLGINTLAVDNRAHGESGGKLEGQYWAQYWAGDLDSALQYLISQQASHATSLGWAERVGWACTITSRLRAAIPRK